MKFLVSVLLIVYPYLHSVIKETLRALLISEPRIPPSKCVIFGFPLPEGTMCSIQPYRDNRDPKIVLDPDKFDGLFLEKPKIITK